MPKLSNSVFTPDEKLNLIPIAKVFVPNCL